MKCNFLFILTSTLFFVVIWIQYVHVEFLFFQIAELPLNVASQQTVL